MDPLTRATNISEDNPIYRGSEYKHIELSTDGQ
jgi:hypothetical protein